MVQRVYSRAGGPIRHFHHAGARMPCPATNAKATRMDFPFPPAPPGYFIVVVARTAATVWALVGLVILIRRLIHWRSVQPTEIRRWGLAALISYGVLFFGICPHSIYDNNLWNWPIITATTAVSIAGITICLAKVYVGGTTREKREWIGGTLISGFLVWLILMICFLPSEVYRRSESSRTQCKYNLKQVGLAMHNYHDADQHFPAAASGTPPVSWRVTLLPYLDQVATYNQYDKKLAWTDGTNRTLVMQRLGVYSCPSNYLPQTSEGFYCSAYSMLTGPQTIGGNPNGTRLRDIMDGSSNTAMIVEACGAEIAWSEPRDVNIDQQPLGINFHSQRNGHSASLMSGYHMGAHLLLCDGGVRWLAANTDPTVLQKLVKIDDAEVLDDF